MINLDTYMLFVVASIIFCATPGPDVLYVVARSVAQGARAGVIASFGVNIGAYMHLFAAIAGLSAILATSAFAFTIVKLIGACYLIWIGVQAIYESTKPSIKGIKKSVPISKQSIFWQGFLCDVLNPKVAIFYLAFLPQFVDVASGSITMQLLILGVTVNMVGLMVDFIAVLFSASIVKKLGASQSVTKWLNRVVGSVFIALGVQLAREKL